MPLVEYRANTLSQHYPPLADLHGRTVIVGQKDQQFNSQVLQNPADEDKDKGIPQAYYMENCVPTGQGLKSVGYTQRLSGIPGSTVFDNIFFVRDINENKFLFSPANNNNYVYDAVVAAWKANTGITDIPSNFLVTIAYLNGVTYVFFQGVGCYQYDTTTKTLIPVTFIGVTATLLKGITASNGFLIAFDDMSIYRSNPTSVLDFTPDITVGAGSGIPEDIKGKIVTCLPITNGFIIYCTKNMVGATFSQNIRYPFVFKEISASAGIASMNHVAWTDNTSYHYAWTQAGLQKVNKTQAELVFIDVSDFITNKRLETYNTTENTIDVTELSSALNLKIAMTAKRFFTISYGIDELTDILVYDISLKRWGRLKYTHVAVFDYVIPNRYGDMSWDDLGTLSWDNLGDSTWDDLGTQLKTQEQPKETLGLLSKDGTIVTVNFDEIHNNDSGILVLGKYEYVRERFLGLQCIEFENIKTGNNFSLRILTSLDGKNIDLVTVPYLNIDRGGLKKYLCDVSGKNHSLSLQGTFHVPGVYLKFTVDGRR